MNQSLQKGMVIFKQHPNHSKEMSYYKVKMNDHHHWFFKKIKDMNCTHGAN